MSGTFGSGVEDTRPVMIQNLRTTSKKKILGGSQFLVAFNVNGEVQNWQRLQTDMLTNPH